MIPVRNFSKLIGYWLRFLFVGSWLALCSWAPAAGAILLACWPHVTLNAFAPLPKWVPHAFAENITLQGVIWALVVAWAIGLLWNAVFLAPRKAWRAVYPLSIEIAELMQRPEIVQETLEKHTVSVIVKNGSSAKSLQCTVVVSTITGANSGLVPRFIYTSNIPRNDEHRVDVANWFFNGGRQNDNIRISNNAPGFAEASMLFIPQDGVDLCLSARAPGLLEAKLWCRIRVHNHRLLIEPIPAGK